MECVVIWKAVNPHESDKYYSISNWGFFGGHDENTGTVGDAQSSCFPMMCIENDEDWSASSFYCSRVNANLYQMVENSINPGTPLDDVKLNTGPPISGQRIWWRSVRFLRSKNFWRLPSSKLLVHDFGNIFSMSFWIIRWKLILVGSCSMSQLKCLWIFSLRWPTSPTCLWCCPDWPKRKVGLDSTTWNSRRAFRLAKYTNIHHTKCSCLNEALHFWSGCQMKTVSNPSEVF